MSSRRFILLTQVSHSRLQQVELDFSEEGRTDGLSIWERQRRENVQMIARTLGMPIGKNVEVWLQGGVRLRGILKLKTELLFLTPGNNAKIEFLVKGIPFTVDEVESCVTTD